MLRKLFIWSLLLLAAFAAWRFGYPAALKYFFRASGTVSVSGGLTAALPGANSMLFLVARNDSGVPVAVKKIINPAFPLKFEMTAANLIMPDLLTRRLYLEAMLNTHGQLGAVRRGDLKNEQPVRVTVISKGLTLTLDTAVK
ncbi:MAG: hypothetical protein A2081_03245 [Elusimicrobia bacterium GWC2_61_19]|nr:MAG: hypothetical protein A2081_03245 [Elusimicrobia bacterium GWC2_61_19]